MIEEIKAGIKKCLASNDDELEKIRSSNEQLVADIDTRIQTINELKETV